jgi:hypothetical protein
LKCGASRKGHRAGAWNHAPEGFDEVRAALFGLVEQVLADEPIEDEGR